MMISFTIRLSLIGDDHTYVDLKGGQSDVCARLFVELAQARGQKLVIVLMSDRWRGLIFRYWTW